MLNHLLTELAECATLIASSLASGIALEPLPHKPGCVSRLRDFEDKKLRDFVLCGFLATSPLTMAVIDGFTEHPRIGLRTKQIVELCIGVTGRNVCLGSSILITPLATAAGRALAHGYAPKPQLLAELARKVVEECGVEESIELYRAIRLASPSYVKPSDVTEAPNVWSSTFEEELRRGGWNLIRVLEDASKRDLVAREVVEGYPRTLAILSELRNLEEDTVSAYLKLLSMDVDTVVARKRGSMLAEVCRNLAKAILSGSLGIDALDRILVANRVTPGSVADIVAVAIALRILEQVLDLCQDRIKLCIARR